MKTIQHIIIICAFFMAQALTQSNSTIAKLANQLKAKLIILKGNNGHRAPFIQTDEVLAATNAFLN